MKPGAMVIADREIVLNEGKETRELLVANVGDSLCRWDPTIISSR